MDPALIGFLVWLVIVPVLLGIEFSMDPDASDTRGCAYFIIAVLWPVSMLVFIGGMIGNLIKRVTK